MTQLERAEVVDVEDPEGRGRVRVSVAGRGRSQRQVWAEVCVPLGAGSWRPPAVGETVLLTHSGHSVVIDEDGITLRLADGSAELVLTTSAVTLRGSATLRLESGASTTLRSSGTCEVTGSLVTIN